jgi:hypothetical protein
MQRDYRWVAGRGFYAEGFQVNEQEALGRVQGKTIAALAALLSATDSVEAAKILLGDSVVRMQAKRLTRNVLNHALDGQRLNSRQILIDLHRL